MEELADPISEAASLLEDRGGVGNVMDRCQGVLPVEPGNLGAKDLQAGDPLERQAVGQGHGWGQLPDCAISKDEMLVHLREDQKKVRARALGESKMEN